MVPRKKLDIGWLELARALLDCARPGSRRAVEARVSEAWSRNGPGTLACLSVRSGFDLLLQALALPEGSEVLCSAITIPDMVRIVKRHGLVPVPVDLEAGTLEVRRESLQAALSHRTRAVLATHLFGSCMPLDSVFELALPNRLHVWEDCAQAYRGAEFRGDRRSDVRMFSFGPIKTATALGGAILQFKDPALRQQVARLKLQLRVQSRLHHFQRLCKFMLVKALLYRWPMAAFYMACRGLGKSHDEILCRAGHSFPHNRLFESIRAQPCFPLLRLLERRLSERRPDSVADRIQVARKLDEALSGIDRPGVRAAQHSHWLFPIVTECSSQSLRHFWEAGFDATGGRGTLQVVQPPSSQGNLTAPAAQEIMGKLIFLPANPDLTDADIARLAQLVRKESHAGRIGELHSKPQSRKERKVKKEKGLSVTNLTRPATTGSVLQRSPGKEKRLF